MQFFVLLLVNIFIGALVYLVISLKLEKSASDYREKRFKKEMDEVIREFNSAAERNISILENKIKILKRLLAQNGDLQSLDITVEDEDTANENKTGQVNYPENISTDKFNNLSTQENKEDSDSQYPGNTVDVKSIKKGLKLLLWKIRNVIWPDKISELNYKENTPILSVEETDRIQNNQILQQKKTHSVDLSANISKDFSSMLDKSVLKDETVREKISEVEIAHLLSSEKDKYSLISQLHDGGCNAEDIARYSNIPMGEVTLILNLIES